MKINIKKICISMFTLFIIVGILLHSNVIKLPIKVESSAHYIADFNDDRALLGASHNVFVAKITKKIKNEVTDSGPITIFEAEIIDNIKGSLEGVITVGQQGGYRNGVFHITEGDSLLEKGTNYILATRYNEEDDSYMLICHPNAKHKMIERSSNRKKTSLDSTTQKIMQLEEAYKNEILLKADIENNRTRNIYKKSIKNGDK